MIIVDAEAFDKAYRKAKDKIDIYLTDNRHRSELKNDIVEAKIKEYQEFAIKLGTDLTTEAKDKATSEAQNSQKYKALQNKHKYWGLAYALEYYQAEDIRDFMDRKIFIFDCEFSSQAYDLIEFCKKNKVEYATSY